MGINGLNTFLKEKCLAGIKEINMGTFNKSTIGVDTSIYFYKFLYKNERFIEGFFQQIYRLLLNGIFPIYIFDGLPPKEKYNTLKMRKEKKKDLITSIKLLESKIQNGVHLNKDYITKELDIYELNKLKKKNISITDYHRNTLKEFLDLIGIPYYQAPEEADVICNSLIKMNKINVVLSDDMDLLVNGTHHLFRNFNVSSNKIMHYDLNSILTLLDLTHEQWIDFCILSGCDYCSRIPGIGIKHAYKYIKEYKTIENIIAFLHTKIPDKIPPNYLTTFNNAKSIYLKIDTNIDLENIKLELNYDNTKRNKALEFLNTHTNLTLKQIENRLKIISLHAK